MNALWKATLTSGARIGIVIISAASCWAIDYQPFDWIPLRPGTNVVMTYFEFATFDRYNNTITGTTKYDTNLDSEIGIARYLHYGNNWDVNLLVPFGSLNDGKISGQQLGSASGVGDPIVTAGFWFVNNPKKKRWLSAASYLTLPIGSYDKHKPLNLGGNRWQHDLQADLTQGFLKKFTLDLSGDWIHYWDNNQAGTGHQTLSQAATFGAWSWLSYDTTSLLRSKLPSALSFGYEGSFGGVQKLDGVTTGAKTEEHQIRLSCMKFITPSWQVLVSVNHDVAVSGQFRQNVGFTVRIAKLFGKHSSE
jgi:Putative MetA-pathway of phenol degradation